jgi:ATP-dependent Clp protease ATP-binding subunit ClpC
MAPDEAPEAASNEAPATEPGGLYALADELDPFLERLAHPRDLLDRPEFVRGVDQLSQPTFTFPILLDYGTGENLALSCMAFEAISRLPPDEAIAARIVERIHRVYLWPFYFATRALTRHGGNSIVGPLLASGQRWWKENAAMFAFLREFVEARVEAGDIRTFGEALSNVDEEQVEQIETVLGAFPEPTVFPLREELDRWHRLRIDRKSLAKIGTLRSGLAPAEIVRHTALMGWLEATLKVVRQNRSVLLVGEPGVGKTTLIDVLSDRLQAEGWTIFEAGAMEVVAGQVYIGQLEERVQELIRLLAGQRKVLWVIPHFHDLIFAGWHRENPRSVLDLIAPSIESGALAVLGETEPAAYERIIQVKPLLRSGIKAITLDPLDESRTRELARAWSRHQALPDGSPAIPERILDEAFQLARQFLDKSSPPGNLIGFVRLALQAHAGSGATGPLSSERLIGTLSDLTGLPTALLSERERLDLGALRTLFERRVLGQAEAVECLVERVAMIKAGLCDPSRPYGVFLFVGPTGTGKTEIAKTLAEFLFGSADRMIRLDMSEFMTEDALRRLIGDTERASDAVALVNEIRKQPFSVVLLDEFEKAHPSVWDLFLQVFDDGRMTDRRGITADFRHAILILTSNLGAVVPTGSGVGFAGESRVFSAESVQRVARQTFRPEFLNRIDRVVVFRPLTRSVARDILVKELRDVLTRRGFRHRDWAVEWEESAIDFLLEHGFSNELGARPLKRAIERYLLSPLAMTIVNHQFPEGDQFLFVRRKGDRLEVEFIDPDPGEREEAPAAVESGSFAIRSLVMDAVGTRDEVIALQARLHALQVTVDAEAWTRRKTEALERTSDPTFWVWEGRHDVLALAEFMDRFERALDTAESLFLRLQGAEESGRSAFSPSLVQRLAQRLYLLESALENETDREPRDAYLLVEAGGDEESRTFGRTLASMYVGWAERRQMRHDIVREGEADSSGRTRFVLAVSGFGAYRVLARENGLHVWEEPDESRGFHRTRVRVRVVPQPVLPADGADAVRAEADRLLAAAAADATIVRRYRRSPSPLVRDSRQAWRTGRLDRVLAGDFDVVGSGV